jgi:hypothetical protein
MMLRDLYSYCEEVSENTLQWQMKLWEFYDLAQMEVEDGESEDHECELAVGDINDLINGEL